MNADHTKILYALIAVLFITVGFLGYQNIRLQTARTGGFVGASPQPMALDASTTAALASVTVGSESPANTLAGTILKLGSGTMQVKGQTGSIGSVAITADTKLQIAGKMKDMATQQKELAAYNAQVALLLKDPIKNKAALAAMQVPTTQEVIPAKLSDFAVGDPVVVVASGIDAQGVYRAATITKVQPL